MCFSWETSFPGVFAGLHEESFSGLQKASAVEDVLFVTDSAASVQHLLKSLNTCRKEIQTEMLTAHAEKKFTMRVIKH